MKNSVIFALENQSLSQNPNSIMSTEQNAKINHSGLAQLKYRKLDVEIPESEIIIGGVESVND